MNIKEIFESLSLEYIEEQNRIQLNRNIQEYKKFKDYHILGKCSLCGDFLTEFYSHKPCFHWLLRPNGIKKKHYKRFFANPISFFGLDSYLRWIANLEHPFRNINDLKSEKSNNKILEYTIRYKNIEWSINMDRNDFNGHCSSNNAKFPHFHLQMKVDNNLYIKFNEFHIPLSKSDIFNFRALDEIPDKIMFHNTFGQGMSIIEDLKNLEILDVQMERSSDYKTATFETSTLVAMENGETISAENLILLLKEAEETKTPIRHLLKRNYPDAHFFTEIKPGEGVPQIIKRTKTR